MNKIRTLIVDDEELARRGLEIRLAKHDFVEVCGQSRNGREALLDIEKLKPDLVFLDIQMPAMNGFQVLRQLAGAEMPVVIFVTAFDKYAIQAFEANALDYLLKPIEDERLQQSLERTREQVDARLAANHRGQLLNLLCDVTGEAMNLQRALEYSPSEASIADYPYRLAIKESDETVFVKIEDIGWIDAAGDYMCVHANGKTHVLRSTMKELEQTLDPKLFVRIHRSAMVNSGRVASARPHINGEYFLRLDCDKELKLSRTYKANLPRILGRQAPAQRLR